MGCGVEAVRSSMSQTIELREAKLTAPRPVLQTEFVNSAGESVVRCAALLPDNTQCTRTRPANVPGGPYCAKHDVPDEDNEAEEEDELLVKDEELISDGSLKIAGVRVSKASSLGVDDARVFILTFPWQFNVSLASEIEMPSLGRFLRRSLDLPGRDNCCLCATK